MKKLFIGIAALLIIGAIAYVINNRTETGVEDASPDFKLTAIELVNQYAQDERRADSLYLGKILQVEGELLAVESGEFTVVTLAGIDLSTVRAQLVDGTDPDSIKDQKKLTIKGRCSGILLDVTLSDCTLIK